MNPEQLQADLKTIRSVLEQSTADKGPHRVIIAGANLFCGIMLLISVPIILFIFSLPPLMEPEDPDLIAIPIIGAAVIAVLVILSLPFLLAGCGLLARKPWGEVAAVISAALNIWNVPLGTAVGAYTFWALAKGKLKATPDPSA